MPQAKAARYAGFGMNTELIFWVYGENAQGAVHSAKAELARLENKLSRFVPGGDIGRLNLSAGKEAVKISPEANEVLTGALRFSEISQGLFDITICPLMDLWDYKRASRAPEKEKIRQALSLVDYRDLMQVPRRKAFKLRKPQQCIDLGGIGKGYAGDRCIDILKKHGVSSAFINLGGNVSTLGNKPDGSPWRVGIRHPRQEGRLLGAVEATGRAVVTSGDYERYFIDREGKRRHHILNPLTGYPARSGLISATVVADSAMTADALSTAIFVAGMEKGLGYLEQLPGAEAVLVDDLQRVYITQGLKGYYQAAEGVSLKDFV